MPAAIHMSDGTSFVVQESAAEVTRDMEPTPGWTYYNDGEGAPRRYFNPAQVAYVIDVQESEKRTPSFHWGGPRVST